MLQLNKTAITARERYRLAKNDILNLLKSNGWEIATTLKIPWARNKYLNTKYYFKPHAIYKGHCDSNFNDCLSTWENHFSIIEDNDKLNKLIRGEL